MKWPATAGHIVALVAALLSLNACSRNGSNDPPPKYDSPIKLVSRPSTIVIPIAVSLDDLQARINEEVPNPLATVDQKLKECIPAQYVEVCLVPKLKCKYLVKCRKVECAVKELRPKVTPDVSCHLKGNVTRGEIALNGEAQTLSMTMPVKIKIALQRIGGVIGSETVTGAADVRASAVVDIDENWSPTAVVNADYSWNDRIGVDILGQRVTFASKVDPKVREAIGKFQRSIPAQIEALALKDRLSGAWAKGFSAIQLSDNPSTWLRFTPKSVGYSGYEVSDGAIRLTLMANGVTETFLGPKPIDPKPTPLPKLTRNLPPAGFQFYLPVLANYNTLEEAAEKALRIREEQTFDVPNVGKVKVTFTDVTIYQTANGALAIGVEMNADPPNEWFDTNGTIWLSAVPIIDNAKRVASVGDLRIAAKTDNGAFNLLASILRLRVVNDRLKGAMRYDFNQKYAEALAKANSALNRELAENLFLDGQITNALVDRVVATPEGLFLGLELSGTAALRYGKPAP